ncbi:MAG: HlyC/CorC family transporter [Muribaculaceae bacterium]|nr:HlyC/CorC family transporter [Muribaculaceae bacterium]MBR1725966.1 HlyC/CorC family transporter [Muribaculaceae bacterium]
MTWSLIIVLISIALSGFFSGMEIAFVSSSKVRAEIDIARGGLIDRVMNVFYSHRDMFISTLLVGNNIVNVVYSIAMARLLTEPLRPLLGGNDFIELLAITVISTLIILLTGEFLPKAVFRINPNYSLRTFSLPLFVCYCVLYPISRFTQLLSAWLMRLLGIKVKNERLGLITVDELDAYLQDNIDKHEDENKEVEHEVKLFENALDFSNTRLRDCMVPRNEMVAVDITDTTRDQLVDLFGKSGLSKIVVYRDSIDQVIGFIQVSELFVPEVDWKTRIKPVLFAPETLLARKMMQNLLDKKRSMAIVLDEYGGTSGMVTLEDLVEEIFGDIEDEHDRNRLTARQIDEHTYEVSGRMEIEDLNERFHLDLPESDDYQTIAGYLLHLQEAIPAVGERIETEQYDFEVVRKTAARIELVKLTVKDNE